MYFNAFTICYDLQIYTDCISVRSCGSWDCSAAFDPLNPTYSDKLWILWWRAVDASLLPWWIKKIATAKNTSNKMIKTDPEMVKFMLVLTLSCRDWVERLPLMLCWELTSGATLLEIGALLHISHSQTDQTLEVGAMEYFLSPTWGLNTGTEGGGDWTVFLTGGETVTWGTGCWYLRMILNGISCEAGLSVAWGFK